jgi:putative oxidoreductase
MQYETNISRTYSAAGNWGLFFLRLVPFSLLFVFHGFQKLVAAYMHQFNGQDWPFITAVAKLGFSYPEYFAIGAAFAEGIFSILLILGFLTRFSAAVISFNFLVAIYAVVISGQKIELPALYLAPAISLLFLGAGGFSIDALIRRKWVERRERRTEDLERYEPVRATETPRPGLTDRPESGERPERRP